MKILGLYNNRCADELFDWIETQGHEIILMTQPLDDNWCREQKFDLAVSYTYRYIIKESTIEILNHNVVNIHNSILPWNRGADPNIWSIVEGTPRGVTLHYIDDKLDKGYVIAQKIVTDDIKNETLESSYNNLDKAAKELFKESFRYYKYWQGMKKKVVGKGSYHSVQDGKKIKSLIESYDIPITEFLDKIHNGGV
jgi:methionyl-tRNA formyltransferase